MSSTSEAIRWHALGAALHELRDARGMTPDDVWAATGISPQAVLALERGQRGLQFLEALYLADAYRTTLKEITERADAIVDDWADGGSRIGFPEPPGRESTPRRLRQSTTDQVSPADRHRRGSEAREPNER